MLEEQGIVTAVRGEQCWVQVAIRNACGQCERACVTAETTRRSYRHSTLKLDNPRALDLHPGDQVALGLAELGLLHVSVIVYLFPLISFFAGTLFGLLLAEQFESIPRDLAAGLGALVGMSLYFLRLRLSPELGNSTVKPVILRRL